MHKPNQMKLKHGLEPIKLSGQKMDRAYFMAHGAHMGQE